MTYDLLQTIENGGCSSKLSPSLLSEALCDLPKMTDERLLVDIETHDDAGVYKLTDDIAIIQTTDFFPPICSDPYTFGQIAAANALSDVYAMGGKAISALNLVMFPSKNVSLDVLKEILRGGMDKVLEAGAVIVGGHTIDDDPPKYGLAVTGVVHPDRIITNAGAQEGDVLILSKPLGMGILTAAKKEGLASEEHYQAALNAMRQLNDKGADIMQEYDVAGATDVTGFGLLGHALKMAQASQVTIQIDSNNIPTLPGVYDLIAKMRRPCSLHRNRVFVEKDCCVNPSVDENKLKIACDAQTSGGLLMSVDRQKAEGIVNALKKAGYASSTIVGDVLAGADHKLIFK